MSLWHKLYTAVLACLSAAALNACKNDNEDKPPYIPDEKCKAVWSFTDGSESYQPISVSNEMVFVPTYKSLYALNPKNGTEIWSWPFPDYFYGGGGINIGQDGTIYVVSDATLYAIDSDDGSTMWTLAEQGLDDLQVPRIGTDGTLYIKSREDYTLYAIDPNVQGVMWSFSMVDRDDTGIVYPEIAENLWHYSIGSNDTVYVTGIVLVETDSGVGVTEQSHLYVLNPTDGSELWSVTFTDFEISWATTAPDGSVLSASVNEIIMEGR